MKTEAIAFAILLLSGAAFAQNVSSAPSPVRSPLATPAAAADETLEQTLPPPGPQPPDEVRSQLPPDFSRGALLRILQEVPDEAEPTVDANLGTVIFHTRNLNALIGYLPFFAPFPGSVPSTTRQLVNPFEMTHTEFPGGAPRGYPEHSRDVRRELMRISRKVKSTSLATQ